MTPTEKARELYKTFEFVEIPNYTSKHEVKECAFRVAEEILNQYNTGIFSYKILDEEEVRFWEQVKKEIRQL